ncbi:MAG: YlmC/YmxH family sporulation protein [Ruminococcaceae bacterium]|nr:YlmC/YmxH family sporulation protein [Oscillospiraceae bacterium]MBO4973098.1 YlmC/YmxH family sporulation protein [Clostridia bacterium]MBQ1259574.1 YlmC/YmxH family sporulation protein [Clostridia bacterium]
MNISSTKELRTKDVINLCNGKRIGCASDFEFDTCSGRIISLIIPGEGGIFGFGSKNEIIIPWSRVECFGEDTVLVRLSENECQTFSDRNYGK